MSGSNWDEAEGYFDVGIEILKKQIIKQKLEK